MATPPSLRLIAGCLLLLLAVFVACANGGQRRRSSEDYFLSEGDILSTKKELMKRTQRKIIPEGIDRWPRDDNGDMVIYYFIKYTLFASKFQLAVKEWDTRTCIKFRELDAEPNGNMPYIRFQGGDGNGCASGVGMTDPAGPNVIHLAANCPLQSAIHEVGHRIGLVHEQNRPDRDDFIDVVFDNVVNGHNKDFVIYDFTVNYAVPYDFSSIMHYDSMSFSRGTGPTILTKNPLYQEILGERFFKSGTLSFMDAKLVNIAYGCIKDWDAACSFLGPCLHGGYRMQDDLGLCYCACPAGTIGIFCETKIKEYNDAMLERMSPLTEVIKTPGIVRSARGTRFTKVIEGQECEQVQLTVDTFYLRKRSAKTGCRQDYLQIRVNDGGDPASIYALCGTEVVPGTVYTSDARIMILHSKTVSPGGYFSARISFKRMENCVVVGGGNARTLNTYY